MTNEGLAEALKCVLLDVNHEIGIFAPEEWVSDKVEKFSYEIDGIRYPCFKGRMFYDDERSLLALTDDEKHLVGGVECGGTADMHIYIFPQYRGQGWMSSLMRSRVFFWEWISDALCAANATVYTGDTISEMERRYHLCMIGGLHVSNEREFISTHLLLLKEILLEIFEELYDFRQFDVNCFMLLAHYFIGYFLYEDVLSFQDMSNKDLIQKKIQNHFVYDYIRQLYRMCESRQTNIFCDYEKWEESIQNHVKLKRDCNMNYVISGNLYDVFSGFSSLVRYMKAYYYLKEKITGRRIVGMEMEFTNQWCENELYKWRLRYRFEHGYRIDDCYRYDYQKHEFVK